MKSCASTLVTALLLLGCTGPTALDPGDSRVLALTHPFNEKTIYWPTAESFHLEVVKHGYDEKGRWYASNDYRASEHGGTHLDAPIHFAPGGRSVADIPVTQLIGPAQVIDIRQQCDADPDYILSPEDIRAHEARHGQ